MNNEEKDWKLYRELLPKWQEKYINIVNEEIRKILDKDELASEKFWEINDYIYKSKKNPGVVITKSSRSNFFYNIVSLLQHEVINMDDLADFSLDMQESIKRYFAN